MKGNVNRWGQLCRLIGSIVIASGAGVAYGDATGWVSEAPREEVRPVFQEIGNTLVIRSDGREGLMGSWVKPFPVKPGKIYAFSAKREVVGLTYPEREAVARIVWTDEGGKAVRRAVSAFVRSRSGRPVKAAPEFPGVVGGGQGGTDLLGGTYRVPDGAAFARVELHYRWGAPGSEVRWSDVSLNASDVLPSRSVKVAAVHYRPAGGVTSAEKCRQFAPFIEEAAQAGVDLVVLPETLTYYDSGRTLVECAEPVPGPSSNYFAGLAKEHGIYIVAGLVEREAHQVYNVAVLVGPRGETVGKYRKVSLPRSEIEAGIVPGSELPVFETEFGMVGMMICYDGFFPEVAGGLAAKGAEVIAWPVWGCNPLLARARACENHVYVISSTYTAHGENWMRSAVFGHDGIAIAEATDFGSLAIAEIDLEQRLHWQSLGDFKAQLPAHRPVLSSGAGTGSEVEKGPLAEKSGGG